MDTGPGPGGDLEGEPAHLGNGGGGGEGFVTKTPRFLAEELGNGAAIS